MTCPCALRYALCAMRSTGLSGVPGNTTASVERKAACSRINVVGEVNNESSERKTVGENQRNRTLGTAFQLPVDTQGAQRADTHISKELVGKAENSRCTSAHVYVERRMVGRRNSRDSRRWKGVCRSLCNRGEGRLEMERRVPKADC